MVSVKQRYLIIALLILAAFIWVIVVLEKKRRIRNQRKRLIKDRPFLSDDEIYVQFYSESGIPKEFVLKIWYDISDALSIKTDRGKLRPNDKMEDLSAWDDGELTESNMEYYLITNSHSNSNIELEDLETIDEVIKFLAKESKIQLLGA